MIPVKWRELIKDEDVFLEHIDPDWREHFHDVDQGIDTYCFDQFTGMKPDEFLKVLKECQ